MSNFGHLLQQFRKRTEHPNTGRKLSQNHFAEELENIAGFQFGFGTISGWERGVIDINRNDRGLLVGIIRVLYEYSGIKTLDEANALLAAGLHRRLTDQEIHQIDPSWQVLSPQPIAEIPLEDVCIGRTSDIQELTEIILQSSKSTVIWLTGRGGLGKSTLAAMIARRVQKHTLLQVVWITYQEGMELGTLTLQIGQNLLPHSIDRVSSQTRMLQVQSALRQGRYLIVIDGVESIAYANQLNSIIRKHFPLTKWLITSRVHPNQVSKAHVHVLNDLSVSETRQLLQHHVGKTGADTISDDVVKQLYAVVGGHPNTLLAIPYMLRFTPLSTLLQSIGSRETSSMYQAIWSVLSMESRSVLVVLSHFSTDGAHETFLAQCLVLTPLELAEALRILYQHNLIQVNHAIEQKRFSIHNLTRHYLHNRLNTQDYPTSWQDLSIDVFVKWCNSTQDEILSDQSAFDLLECCRLSWLYGNQTAEKLVELREQALLQVIPIFSEAGWTYGWEKSLQKAIALSTPVQGRLLNQLGILCRMRGYYAESAKYHHEAENFANQRGDLTLLQYTQKYLAQVYFVAREYDNATLYSNNALEAFANHDSDHSNLASMLSLRGAIAAARNEYQVAADHLRQAIDLYRQGIDYQEVARAYYNFGRLSWQMGQHQKASEAFQQAKAILQNNVRSILVTRIALTEGSMQMSVGNVTDASQVFSSVDLDFLESSHNFELLGKTLNNIANAMLQQGQLKQAEAAAERGISVFRSQEDSYELANMLDTLGDIYVAMKQRERAASTYFEAHALVLGLPHISQVEELSAGLQAKLSALRQLKT